MTTEANSSDGRCDDTAYSLADGVWSRQALVHREAEYDSRGFAVLARMQSQHFWYLGRRRFIAELLRKHIPVTNRSGRRVIDLGAGCGGFIQYLAALGLFPESEFAVGDSSLAALKYCKQTLASTASAYQIDLMNLGWSERWDTTLLLDVIEHLPDDVGALREVYKSLEPGGYCLVTVPALKQFWSWNDDAVGHQRRYSVKDLSERLQSVGFRVLDARYFMFLLSPLLLASRLANSRKVASLTDEDRWRLVEESHAIPAAPVNQLMRAVFSLETPAGHLVRFPWGTSAIALCQKA